MTIRYVGPGGNDTNDGLSWANRKLTLNGVEDTPVASGDIVYVGPGIYRELLTCDVSGASAITYIGDVTGEHTDGVGGVVRITGSDDDVTKTRANCISANSKNYRTFQGFRFDGTSNNLITLMTSCSNCVVQDCTFDADLQTVISIAGSGTNNTVRRCAIFADATAIVVTHSTTLDNSGIVIENCLMIAGGTATGINIMRVGGVTVRNCTVLYTYRAIAVSTALSAGQTTTVNNCLLMGVNATLMATALGEITEDYNTCIGGARSNVATGANSNSNLLSLDMPLLLSGFVLSKTNFGALADYSTVKALGGAAEATDDLYGLTRPTTSAKKSWGAVQFSDVSRSTTQTYNTSAASLKLADAGVVQFRVPVTAVSTTIACRVYREADYAGTLPRMVIKQPGQSDTTVTDTGGAGAFNELTATLTPASSPGYVIVELQSLNTATTGSYAVYFDSLAVS